MKKVLVTGATGFLGNYIIEELLKADHAVVASSANQHKAMQFSWYDKASYISLDLSQIDLSINYYDFFSRPDLMIHLAWEGLPNYKSALHLEENLPRHKGFLKNMLDNGLRDLTVTGTCFEYGMQEGQLNEEMPVMPSNPYAIAKDELRKFLQEYQDRHFFDFKWLRLFYMYGKGQNPNSLLSQLDKAIAEGNEVFNMSSGEQIRDFLPIEVMTAYIVKAALQTKADGIINVCSNQPVTVKQFVANYLKKINKSITLNLGYYPYPDYEPRSIWGDNTKLKTILNNE